MNFESFENESDINIKLLLLDKKIRTSFTIIFLRFFFLSIILGYIAYQDISTREEMHNIKSNIENLLKDKEKYNIKLEKINTNIKKSFNNIEEKLNNIKLHITIIFYQVRTILCVTSKTLENIETIYNITTSSSWDLFKAGFKYSSFNYENYCNHTLSRYPY